MKSFFKKLLAAILAGGAICIGAIAYLSCENKIVGAVFFSVGLFIVLVNKYSLFTGSVCYCFKKGGTPFWDIPTILIGNGIGAFIIGSAIRFTRLTAVVEKAEALMAIKSSDSLLSIFILAILCNFMIYFSVNCFKFNEYAIGKYLGILLCIPVFIISSYEHCVANMCYMALAADYSGKALLALAVAVGGNAVGGILICRATEGAHLKNV